jgi:hypothetical protein
MRRFKGIRTTTHQEELVSASAHFLSTRQRIIEAERLSNPHGKKNTRDTPKSGPDAKHGGGGAWRAFVSEFLHQSNGKGRGNFTRAAEEYRRIKADDGEHYKRLFEKGRTATESHKAGGLSFPSEHRSQVPPAAAMVMARIMQRSETAAPAAEGSLVLGTASSGTLYSSVENHTKDLKAISIRTVLASRTAQKQDEFMRQVLAVFATLGSRITQSLGPANSEFRIPPGTDFSLALPTRPGNKTV